MLQPTTISLLSTLSPARAGSSPMATTSDFALALADLAGGTTTVLAPTAPQPTLLQIVPSRPDVAAPGKGLPADAMPTPPGRPGATDAAVSADTVMVFAPIAMALATVSQPVASAAAQVAASPPRAALAVVGTAPVDRVSPVIQTVPGATPGAPIVKAVSAPTAVTTESADIDAEPVGVAAAPQIVGKPRARRSQPASIEVAAVPGAKAEAMPPSEAAAVKDMPDLSEAPSRKEKEPGTVETAIACIGAPPVPMAIDPMTAAVATAMPAPPVMSDDVEQPTLLIPSPAPQLASQPNVTARQAPPTASETAAPRPLSVGVDAQPPARPIASPQGQDPRSRRASAAAPQSVPNPFREQAAPQQVPPAVSPRGEAEPQGQPASPVRRPRPNPIPGQPSPMPAPAPLSEQVPVAASLRESGSTVALSPAMQKPVPTVSNGQPTPRAATLPIIAAQLQGAAPSQPTPMAAKAGVGSTAQPVGEGSIGLRTALERSVAPAVSDTPATTPVQTHDAIVVEAPRPAIRPEVTMIALPTTPAPQPDDVLPAARMFAQAMFAAPTVAFDTGETDEEARPITLATGVGGAFTADPGPIAVPATAAADRNALDMSRGDWMMSMIDKIETLRDESGAVGETRLKLSPDALGNIDITVRRDDAGQYQVRIAADTAQARTVLAEAAPRLNDMAEARGLKLGHTSVDTGTGAQSGSTDSNRRDGQQGSAAPRRPASAFSDTAAASADGSTTDTRLA